VDSLLHLMASNVESAFLFIDLRLSILRFQCMAHTVGNITMPFGTSDLSTGSKLFLLMCSISFKIDFLNSGALWAFIALWRYIVSGLLVDLRTSKIGSSRCAVLLTLL
jgi:hypothetical protein